MFAFETATSVRKVSELGLRSVLLFIARTLPPMMEKIASGLTLLCGPGESSRKVLLTIVMSAWPVTQNPGVRLRIEEDIDVRTTNANAVVADVPV